MNALPPHARLHRHSDAPSFDSLSGDLAGVLLMGAAIGLVQAGLVMAEPNSGTGILYVTPVLLLSALLCGSRSTIVSATFGLAVELFLRAEAVSQHHVPPRAWLASLGSYCLTAALAVSLARSRRRLLGKLHLAEEACWRLAVDWHHVTTASAAIPVAPPAPPPAPKTSHEDDTVSALRDAFRSEGGI